MGQAHALVNLFIALFPAIGGLTLAVVIGSAVVNPIGSARLALTFYGAGFALFLLAKISMFQSGHLVTFGSHLMRRPYGGLYRTGYVLMAVGLLFAVGLLVTHSTKTLPRSSSTPERAGRGRLVNPDNIDPPNNRVKRAVSPGR